MPSPLKYIRGGGACKLSFRSTDSLASYATPKTYIMHILFLTQVLPYPLDAGPKTRAYYTLRYLAQAHEITLLSFIRSTDTREAVSHLEELCDAVYTVPIDRSAVKDAWHLSRSMLSATPFLIRRDWVPAMQAHVQRLVTGNRQIDAVHADQLWMAPYAVYARHAAHGRRPYLVLDQHNAVFQIPRRLAQHEPNPLKRMLFALEGRKLRQYEIATCNQFDHVVWVTDEDRTAVSTAAVVQMTPSTVIPICVDPTRQMPVQRASRAHRVTFLGGLHWPPNAAGITWFARDVWPAVRDAVPHVTLTVIGKSPPADLLALAQSDDRIEVTGYVPELAPYLEETAVFIIPLHAGGGMRVKLLDAWAWELPVVSTRIGAEGIQARNDDNVLLADTPGQFAEAVVRVVGDTPLAQRLALGGRRTVEHEYDWRTIYRRWDAIYHPHLVHA